MRDPRELAGAWSAFQRHGSAPPSPALDGVVARSWWATWDLTGQPDYRQLLPPSPSVQLTFPTDGEPLLRGVHRRHFARILSGAGGVLGVAFVPGAFRRFLDAPVSSLTDRTVPAASVFGPLPPVPPGDTATADAFLAARLPPPDPTGDTVAVWVHLAATTPDLRRVDDYAPACGVGVRQLQRLFAEHVGVSPKWLLRRFRLREVTDTLAAAPGAPVDWAGLAADLGYVDQAHLSRDFAAMFGEPPTTYAARY
ncbi:helix-turn-helix domain-containing protein [Dactylosporangium sp. NPDC005555]|uniref:AraC family transcriptional regulator n=1 Tax=Dactylosporangium sp. NPDC005555 TaxID=3154889 RepID=UPI0033A3DCA8